VAFAYLPFFLIRSAAEKNINGSAAKKRKLPIPAVAVKSANK
jgi:hypothetical protein